jgi:hypothetical protein
MENDLEYFAFMFLRQSKVRAIRGRRSGRKFVPESEYSWSSTMKRGWNGFVRRRVGVVAIFRQQLQRMRS